MKLRVLVVDDDRDALAIVGAALTHAGYIVVYEDVGARAIETAAVSRPAAILLDFRFNDTTGERIAAGLHHDARCSGIPVIVITADVDAVKVSFPPNVRAVLVKPFDPADLVEAVSALFGTPSGATPR
jgi:CheY-like chemotaxis protein